MYCGSRNITFIQWKPPEISHEEVKGIFYSCAIRIGIYHDHDDDVMNVFIIIRASLSNDPHISE